MRAAVDPFVLVGAFDLGTKTLNCSLFIDDTSDCSCVIQNSGTGSSDTDLAVASTLRGSRSTFESFKVLIIQQLALTRPRAFADLTPGGTSFVAGQDAQTDLKRHRRGR